ncbi:hypothetical protein Tco_1345914 [Tanacetum coccineum]
MEKHGLVNGLPSKLFTNEHNCVAYNKGKQHKASYKAITAVSTISAPLQLLHMDLFGPTSIRSIDHKVLVTKPHNKTPYELLSGKVPNISHLKPFGCHVTILNTSDHLGKFERKADGKVLLFGLYSFKTNQPAGPKVHDASEMVESSSDYAEELVRLQNQAYEANATAEKHMSQADLTASRNRVPAGKIDSAAGVFDGPTETSTPVFKPVHTDATSLPLGHSLGSSEHSTRYPSHYDLANSMSLSSEIKDIHHHPDTGIFSSSSYDDDFGGTVTNLAPSVVVDSVPTKRVNTIHPQSQIRGDLTSPVQTRVLEESKFCYAQRNAIVYIIKSKTACPSTRWENYYWDKMDSEKQKRCQRRGTIDKTLFIKKNSRDIILVQVYVDDIIFGSTNKAWLKQKPKGIFISQDKYVRDMLKKFDMESVRPATTPFEASKPKSKDEPDDAVNVHLYRSMIGSLMYLTTSRPDIQFAVSACSRHQVTPLSSNLNAIKKIFKYLKGQPKLGLWYPRDSPFVLEAYSDSDYAGSHGDRKSTTGGCQFLGRRLISW